MRPKHSSEVPLTTVLETYAIQIQMYSDLKETRKLKVSAIWCKPPSADIFQEIYAASMQVKNAIPHPRIMGVIRECGGKMWMMESKSMIVLRGVRLTLKKRTRKRPPTSSSRSDSTTNLDRPNESRCSNTSFSLRCSWEVRSTRLIRKKRSRKYRLYKNATCSFSDTRMTLKLWL